MWLFPERRVPVRGSVVLCPVRGEVELEACLACQWLVHLVPSGRGEGVEAVNCEAPRPERKGRVPLVL